MILTADQIRAARALKNWSQAELARRVDMATPSIGNIESGKHKPSQQTQDAIRTAFEGDGIEFIEGGVRFRNDLLTVIEGKDDENVFLRLLDDIFYTIKKGDDVLWSFIDESISPVEVLEKEKLIREKGARYRNLVRYGDSHFSFTSEEYRWLPKGYFLNNLTVVYGDKFALVVNKSGTHDVEKILIINDATIAEMKRKEFDIIWSYGGTPA